MKNIKGSDVSCYVNHCCQTLKKGFPELKIKNPFKGSKIMFREPNKVTQGAHRTFKCSCLEPVMVLPTGQRKTP